MSDTDRPTTTTDLEARLAALSPAKRALLAQRLARAHSSDPSKRPAIPTADGHGGKAPHPRATARALSLPLSFAQQRLWFLDQWAPGSANYNVAQAWWLQGTLDVERVRNGFARVIARHDSLRTAFSSEHGEPRQRILDELPADLTLVDLTALPEDRARARALAEAQDVARRGFDLGRPPLLRVVLFRVAAATHLLVLVIHHIVTDGWSMAVLCRELSALYADPATALPALPVQYPDYALRQREPAQEAARARQLDYWRKHLTGTTPLALPTDRPRPAAQSYRGARYFVAVSAALTAALKRLAQRERATPFMLLLAAFQVLLARLSGKDDIAVGSPIAARDQREFEPLIGFFVNTLVLRNDLSGDPRFTELLARVRENALDAYDHQELPFEKLVEDLRPERDPSRAPLIQVMFALQNAPAIALALPGLDVAAQELDTGTAKFDLTLSLTDTAEGLRGSFEYATDLFDATTMARMAGHFTTLLEGIVADPETPIGKLPLLTAVEQRQLAASSDAAVASSRERCIHQLFEEQVARSPRATAVSCDQASLTYSELNARANRLAHHLICLGVGPDTLVAVCLPRSLELIFALLAILKAGGAYVPLDPDYPAARLAFMLEDSKAPALITHEALLAKLPAYSGHAVCLDRDLASPASVMRVDGDLTPLMPDTTDPPCRTAPEHLAYVIYTSGSTGTPKGVMIEHANVVRLFSATQRWFGFGARDVWTGFHSAAFDFSVWEIWGALLHGGRLVIVPYLVSRDPDAFHALLRRERVTVLNQTPSAFNPLIEADVRRDVDDLRSLRLVIFGGEALAMASLRPWFDRHGDEKPKLVNMYGITETTVHVTYRPVCRADLDASPGSMIGTPIPDLRIDLVDRHLQPVPIGVAGEIVVGGAGVARGYLNRPELTAERFVADPFGDAPEARRYRSGDLARRTASGDLEYFGRIDRQVKLRGFRIELGEIETALTRLPQVRQAVVLLREDRPGDARLVAYLTGDGPPLVSAELRAALKRQLPDYMVPATFVQVPAFPLTANGKVDRSALPTPGQIARTQALPGTLSDLPTIARDRAVAPGDTIERHLTAIWETLLDRRPIGPHDNFFDLGGHSLLAVELMDHIAKAFARRLPLDALWFRAGTIAALAAAIRDGHHGTGNAELVVVKSGTRRPLFVAHTMGGNLFHYYELARRLHPEQTVYGLQARGVFGGGEPDSSVKAIANRCVESIRSVQPAGPYLLAGFSSGGVVAYEIAQQLTRAGHEVALLALLDTYAPSAITAWRVAVEAMRLVRNRSNLRHVQELAYFFALHRLKLKPMRELRNIGEAHRWAHWGYRPRSYPHAVDLFTAEQSAQRAQIDGLGWSRWAKGLRLAGQFPGGHGGLVKPPIVAEVAARIQARIDEIEAAHPAPAR